MKENKYNDDTFFEKYSQMSRSKLGLAGAGEWEILKKMFPDINGKRFLDLGCGYGWHCRYASEMGAAEVLGLDLSSKMLEIARQKSQGYQKIDYYECAIEDFDFPASSWDVVFSSLAIHYLESFEKLAKNVYRTLSDKGEFLFSVEHPVFTAEGSQDWIYKENGEILCFPVDRYFYEGKRTAHFLGENVTKYHRTLTTYLRQLLSAGFEIEDFAEPEPPQSMRNVPGMKEEMRRPMMLIVKAKKR